MQVIAMHGWLGDSRGWAPLAAAARRQGWPWQSADRGYGPSAPVQPQWLDAEGPRVVVGHSLGPHLLPADLLRQADAVVLLASFGRFVPSGAAGRPLISALRAMAQQLQGPEAQAMLRRFLEKAAAPQPLSALPVSILDSPLSAEGRERLLHDLILLQHCEALPEGFPTQARCLVVEAEQDQIVGPEARAWLQRALPAAERIGVEGAGHALLVPSWLEMVIGWLREL
ncbi:alpha/beta fold hydrolase [Cyanobium sp. LEGE 06143]|uniref:alpha/beta fold hydrolase n=1 Tax=Cyanobium sp. LEGE 06143 TaxID=945727 RepID=UPI001D158AA4|nr:alpha/beta hydrolase [Cyanobium sp. LEGE 06143]